MSSSPPSKSDRQKCWTKRDTYWQCLDQNNEDKVKCEDARKVFEDSCTKQWYNYFLRNRDYQKYKEKLKQGYNPEEAKS